MAIAFVNFGVNSSTAVGTTLVITPSVAPVAGHTLVVVTDALLAAGAVVSVVDNGSPASTYTKQAALASSLNTTECWSTGAGGVGIGVTAITITFTTTHIERAGVTAEYSGVLAIGLNNTNSGTASPMTVAITTQDANNYVVAGLGAGALETVTATSGTKRGTTQGTTVALALVDNTAASATSVSDTATLSTGTSWAAAAVELRSVLPATAKYGQSYYPLF